MELMRLYQAIILLSSVLLLNACSTGNMKGELSDTTGTFIDIKKAPLNMDETMLNAIPGFLWNNAQYLRFSLNRNEKLQHRSSVYHALDNTKNGEVVAWYSKERKASGKVRVIHSYPQSGGYCRVYQTFIQLNGALRHKTNAACKEMGRYWRFVN